MNDNEATISFFKNEIKSFVKERNWKKYHTIKNLIQAIQIEAAELSELFLFKELSVSEVLSNKELLENVSGEIADVFIYLLSLVNELDLDLTNSFLNKMMKNRQKYPTKEFNNGNYYKK